MDATNKGEQSPSNLIKWKCALPNTILDVLKAREGWVETKSNVDWDFYWIGRDWLNNQYLQHNFQDQQRICHFRNDYELTRKDNLAKNIKKMKRQLEKELKLDEAKLYDFIPPSYVLPNDYHMFVEEFRHHPEGTVWIMKPVGGAQGRGIFLFTKLKDIAEWRKKDVFPNEEVECYVAQRYVDNPYLIGGKKFDTRVYVLVTSFQPLRAWLHREGFARLSGTRYDNSSIEDAYAHLTNVAVQKTAPDYDPERGLKWSMQKLRRYLIAIHGRESIDKLMDDITTIFICSLKAVQNVIMRDKHCFEMYGYDIMLDSNLKPWLLEVNASPSLTPSSKEDFEMKFRILNQLLDVVDMEGVRSYKEIQIGGFDLFWDDGPVYAKDTNDPDLLDCFKPRLNANLGCTYPGMEI